MQLKGKSMIDIYTASLMLQLLTVCNNSNINITNSSFGSMNASTPACNQFLAKNANDLDYYYGNAKTNLQDPVFAGVVELLKDALNTFRRMERPANNPKQLRRKRQIRQPGGKRGR